MKAMPATLKYDIHNVAWLQKPLSEKEITQYNGAVSRIMPIKAKIALSLFTACLSITILITFMSRMLFSTYMKDQFNDNARGIAQLASSCIEPNRVPEYVELGEEAIGYWKTEEMLENIRASSPNIRYIYVYMVTPDGFIVVFDLDTENAKGDAPGTLVAFDDSDLKYVDKMLAGEVFEPFVTNNRQYRNYLSAFYPVYNDEGNGLVKYETGEYQIRVFRRQTINGQYVDPQVAMGKFVLTDTTGRVTWKIVSKTTNMPIKEGMTDQTFSGTS